MDRKWRFNRGALDTLTPYSEFVKGLPPCDRPAARQIADMSDLYAVYTVLHIENRDIAVHWSSEGGFYYFVAVQTVWPRAAGDRRAGAGAGPAQSQAPPASAAAPEGDEDMPEALVELEEEPEAKLELRGEEEEGNEEEEEDSDGGEEGGGAGNSAGGLLPNGEQVQQKQQQQMDMQQRKGRQSGKGQQAQKGSGQANKRQRQGSGPSTAAAAQPLAAVEAAAARAEVEPGAMPAAAGKGQTTKAKPQRQQRHRRRGRQPTDVPQVAAAGAIRRDEEMADAGEPCQQAEAQVAMGGQGQQQQEVREQRETEVQQEPAEEEFLMPEQQTQQQQEQQQEVMSAAAEETAAVVAATAAGEAMATETAPTIRTQILVPVNSGYSSITPELLQRLFCVRGVKAQQLLLALVDAHGVVTRNCLYNYIQSPLAGPGTADLVLQDE